MPAKGQGCIRRVIEGRSARGILVSIIGAGIAGAWQALLFAQAGHEVTLHERSDAAMTAIDQPLGRRHAGAVLRGRGLGARHRHGSACARSNLWREHFPQTPFNGSLVVAHPRDRADFERFARTDLRPPAARRRRDGRDSNRRSKAVSATGCFIADEGHVEPRRVLPQLHARITEAGGTIQLQQRRQASRTVDGIVIDCRGLAARDTQPELRGVKGEMIIVETDEIELSRPVRLIHPRWPLYIIPRADHQFMIGATSIEAEDNGVSVRSALELLSAAYAVHPAFAEARIVEFGSGLRPAFPDNLPRIAIAGREDRRQRTLSPRLPAGAGAGGTDARLCRARRDRQ